MLSKEQAVETALDLLSRLDDPDLVLQKLGIARWDLNRLETDDEISGALETRREAVMAVPWHLDPYDSEQAEWLEAHLRPHMEDLLVTAWTAIPYGYSVQELVYTRMDGGRIGLARVASKPMSWFEPRRDGTLWMTLPNQTAAQQVDTKFKFVLTRNRPSHTNPYGEALLSRAYWPWLFRVNGWQFRMRFLERFADPLLLGKVNNPQGFVDAMTALGMTAIVGVGPDEDVSAVTASGKGEFSETEDALVRRIQRLILGQTASSGDAGGFSKGQMQENVRIDKRNADVRLLTRSAQTVVSGLWQLNNFPGEPPRFVLEDGTGLESERADRDAKLVSSGVVKGFTEQYMLGNYDFEPGDLILAAPGEQEGEAAEQPDIDDGVDPTSSEADAEDADAEDADAEDADAEDAEDMHAPTRASIARAIAQLAEERRDLAENPVDQLTEDQQELEGLADSALADSPQPLPPTLLREAILAATDPEDLVERLLGLYSGDNTAAFRDMVERALFAADVVGYVSADTHMGQDHLGLDDQEGQQ